MTTTGEPHVLEVAARVMDPDLGAALAREWMARSRPGLVPGRTRTHTGLYRGPDDISARVSVQVEDADDPGGDTEELTLLVRSRGGAVAVSELPDDPALPSLATMLDPRTALEVLARASAELSVELSRRSGIGCEARVVHHPRSGACVIRYDLSGPVGRAHRQVYAKVYPSAAEARASAASHEVVGGRLLRGHGAVVRLPRLLGLDIDTRVVLLESLGPPDPIAPDVRPDEAARVLRTLHGSAGPRDLTAVTPEDEISRVEKELALVEPAWPDLSARVVGHLGDAAAQLAGTRPGAGVLSHGDYTPSQLLRMPGGVIGLLDLDTLRRAEPAADLGRYLAYASVRRARRGSTDSRSPDSAGTGALFGTVIDAYCGGGPIPSLPERTRAHERLQLVLLALRAARRFKPERVALALSLLDHAAARRPS